MGVTAIQIMELCKRHDFNAYIIWNAALVAEYEAPIQDPHDKALCLHIVEEHAYFITHANIWKHARVSTMRPKLPKRLYTPPQPSTYPIFEEWFEWNYGWGALQMCEGHY